MGTQDSKPNNNHPPQPVRVVWERDKDLIELKLQLMETVALQHQPVLLELKDYEGVPSEVLAAVTEAEQYARSQGKSFAVRAPNKAFREAIYAKFRESDTVRKSGNASAKDSRPTDEAHSAIFGEDSRAAHASQDALKSISKRFDEKPASPPQATITSTQKTKKAKKKRSASDYAKLAGLVFGGTFILAYVEYQIIFNSSESPVSMPKKIMESNDVPDSQLEQQISVLTKELEQAKRDLSNARRERDALKEALRIFKDSR